MKASSQADRGREKKAQPHSQSIHPVLESSFASLTNSSHRPLSRFRRWHFFSRTLLSLQDFEQTSLHCEIILRGRHLQRNRILLLRHNPKKKIGNQETSDQRLCFPLRSIDAFEITSSRRKRRAKKLPRQQSDVLRRPDATRQLNPRKC